MKKLNNIKFSALLMLFLSLSFGVWAQQKGEASLSATNDESQGAKTELEAKKEIYRQLGKEWPYQDDASMDVAKEVLARRAGVATPEITSDPEVARKQTLVDYMANKQEWANSNPEKLKAAQAELQKGMVVEISADDYKKLPADRKAQIDANPSIYNVTQSSTK